MQVRFCHNCGAKIAPNAKFCGSCGTAVLQREAPQPQQEEEIVAAVQPEAVQTEISQPEAAQSKPNAVFTLDSLEEPVSQPEVVRSSIFTLDSLSHEEVPQEPALPEQPLPEPDYTSAPTIVLTPDMAPQPHQPVPPINETPQEEPADPEKAPAPKKAKGILARRGFGRTLLAVLLCILIFVWSFATLTVLNVRLILSGDHGDALMSSVLSAVDLTKVPADVLVGSSDLTLTQWAVGQITEHYQGRVHLDDPDLREFLEDSSFVDFLAKELNESFVDVVNGSGKAAVTTAEIEALLTADAEVISDIFGADLSQEEISAIAQSAVDSGALDTLTAKSLKSQVPLVYNSIHYGLSWVCVGIMGLILVLLILLLGSVNRSILRTFGDTGITLMVVSTIWGIGGLLAMLLPNVFHYLPAMLRAIGTAVGQLLKLSLIPTAAAFGTGFVLLLIKIIGKKIVTQSAAKQA